MSRRENMFPSHQEKIKSYLDYLSIICQTIRENFTTRLVSYKKTKMNRLSS